MAERPVRDGAFCFICALFLLVGHFVTKGRERLHLPDYPPLHPMDLIMGEGGTLLVALTATFVMARVERRQLVVYGIARVRDLFGRFFRVGALWGTAMPSAIILLIFAAGAYKVHGLNMTGSDLIKFSGLWVFTVLLIGLSEEITFRGYFLYTLADGIGFWAAAIIDAIGFGALHYYTKPNVRWEDWVALTLLTIFITLALRRTGSLAFPIGMYAAFDFMFFYALSGMNEGHFAIGRLLNADFPGSIRATGGLLGPEASWLCFPVVVTAIAMLHWTYRQAKWPVRVVES
jgi:membrane protease YdiL (CAAX protease family)